MIYGIGTDILKISQLASSVTSVDDPFVQKVFTKAEQDLILSRPCPLYSYATHFAGKEAVFKSLNLHADSIRLQEIEILENKNGQPHVTLHGAAHNFALQRNIHTIHISLSYDTDYATAFAIAEI